MAFLCCMVDQRSRVKSSKPAAGSCSRCGGGASIADIETATRLCSVPLRRRCWKAVICTFCGAVLKKYLPSRLRAFRPPKIADSDAGM